MDPVTILSIAAAAGSLAFKCGTIVQTLYALRDRFRQAELTILSVIQDCRTIELAWSQIQKWAANNLDVDDEHNKLAERLQLSIYSGQLFMAELEKDLASLENIPKHSTLRRRTKIVWNESMLRVHQDRIQRQTCALTLLLEVIQLPLRSDRAEVLSIKEPVFRSVEDSVRSIVPTNLSTCSDDASSIRSFDDNELSYVPYAFEDMLFTSYVYKRNFRTNRMHFRQVRQRPEITNPKLVIEGSIAQIENVSRDVGVSQKSAITLSSVVCGTSSLVDATVRSGHSRGFVSTMDSTGDPHNHPSDMEFALYHNKSKHEPSVGVESTVVADTRLFVANIHTNVSTVDLHTATEGAVQQSVGIKRRPSSSARTWQKYLESAGNMSDSSLAQLLLGHSQTGFELEESSIEQAIRLISQFNQDDLEAARKWDQIETVLLEYMLMMWLRKGDFAMPNWTQCIAKAATYRELAEISGILHRTPTALQLACATKNSVVVEYLLSSGCPLIPLDWRVHPFILATKRRCKIILELFLKLANDSVSQVIRNYALAMVINQDCALSENALYLDQNDNRRIGADVNIVSLLLANGSSPNLTVQGGISVLSLAIQAAYSSNPFSLQIVEILLRRGASFGSQEQALMTQGPLKAFGMLKQRHKINSPPQQTIIQSRLSHWPRVDTKLHEVVLETAHDEPQSVAIDREGDWRRLPLPSGVLANVPEPSRLNTIWIHSL